MRRGAVVITTYGMFRMAIHQTHPNAVAARILAHRWGLLILDEVHTAAADKTEECILQMHRVKCKLGLTATLVREDGRVVNLDVLVGPKLYEAKWPSLADAGYIAKARCVEVLCPMQAEFSRRYIELHDEIHRNNFHDKKRLWTLNPNKYAACLYILTLHQRRHNGCEQFDDSYGDKCLILIDDIVTLETYHAALKERFAQFFVGMLYGETSESDKKEVLASFKKTRGFAVLLLSRVGDDSIDIPDASVLIEIDCQGKSRRQEAQRLGRILRAKSTKVGQGEGEFNASFYAVVSKDTGDMSKANERRDYLVAQGYFYIPVEMSSEMGEPDDSMIRAFLLKFDNYSVERVKGTNGTEQVRKVCCFRPDCV
jgi:DNA excision repair protein ERCC-3